MKYIFILTVGQMCEWMFELTPFMWQEKSREIASLLLCVMVTYICMMTQIEYILLSTIFLLQFWSQSAIHSVNYALCFNISTRKLITPIFNYIMGYLFWFSGPMNNFLLFSYVDSCIYIYELLNNKNFPIKIEMVNNGDKELM